MARRYCTKCHFPERTCICALVKQYQSIDYSGEVHVLQHPEEVKQSKNTLTLVTQLLPSVKVWVGESELDFIELQQQISASDNQWACFYPSRDSQLQTTEQPDLPSSNVIYIDATWRKARKIWHLNPWLWQVPCFRLNKTPTAKYRIRKNHAPEQLSTLEAIAYSLGHTANTQVLLDLFEQFQQQTEAFIPKLPQDACFRAITALSVQGALEKECRLPFKQVQHRNGSAVKLPKGGA